MYQPLLLGVLLFVLQGNLGGALALGAPPVSDDHKTETTPLIRDGADATDHAWETFHQAAIEGTLASPTVQAHIEHHLHHVRMLLMEARKAERDNDVDSVKAIIKKIMTMTNMIIQASLERKS